MNQGVPNLCVPRAIMSLNMVFKWKSYWPGSGKAWLANSMPGPSPWPPAIVRIPDRSRAWTPQEFVVRFQSEGEREMCRIILLGKAPESDITKKLPTTEVTWFLRMCRPSLVQTALTPELVVLTFSLQICWTTAQEIFFLILLPQYPQHLQEGHEKTGTRYTFIKYYLFDIYIWHLFLLFRQVEESSH